MLFPYRIEALMQRVPWANWTIIGVCSLVWIAVITGVISENLLLLMFNDEWKPFEMVSSNFLHLEFFHLFWNMLFLWVFGNAVCGNIGNIKYCLVYLVIGTLSSAVHLAFDGRPAIGASGALYGIVGFTLAMYPVNRVHMCWWLLIRGGTFTWPTWGLVAFWAIFDIAGVFDSYSAVAHWAHIGGLISGIAIGAIMLKNGWIKPTQWDNATLIEVFSGRKS